MLNANWWVQLIVVYSIVKFVGDQADSSRGNLSAKTKERFTRAMMEQPGANFAIPTNEEEDLKRQIAKAYMQDKDVDVAVLEEKLRKRAQWRKEMMSQAKSSNGATVDEDGWWIRVTHTTDKINKNKIHIFKGNPTFCLNILIWHLSKIQSKAG